MQANIRVANTSPQGAGRNEVAVPKGRAKRALSEAAETNTVQRSRSFAQTLNQRFHKLQALQQSNPLHPITP